MSGNSETPANFAGLQVRGVAKAESLKNSANQSQEQSVEGDESKLRRIFVIFVLINLITNYDTGVIPASLMQMREDIEMNYQEQAAVGALAYLGLSAASIIVSTVYQQFSAAKTIEIMLFFNMVFSVLFSLAETLYTIYLARIGMGFTQAFCVIYGPVWVNEFSPGRLTTQWMGILQAAVPLGIMLGYAIAGAFINFLEVYSFTWRNAIQLQAVCLVPLIFMMHFADKSQIDVINVTRPAHLVAAGDTQSVDTTHIRIDSIDINKLESFFGQMKMLFTNGIFICMTGALCSLQFVVTGIQYWITVYLIVALGADRVDVYICFVVACITAPLCGVVTGGWLADHFGGYKGKNVTTAIKLCIMFALLACWFSIPIGLVGTLFYVTPLLWTLLFFGSCIMPTAVGVNVNTVSKEYQSASSSISQLLFNLFGFFLAPVASAAIMDLYESPIEGLRWGFKFILSISIFGFVWLIAGLIVAERRLAGYSEMEEEMADQVKDLPSLSKKQLALEIYRRRLHSNSF